MITTSLLMFFVYCGCGNSGNSDNSIRHSIVDLNELLNTKNVLAQYGIGSSQANQVEEIIDVIGDYMIVNIDAIVEDNLHREKTRIEKKAYSVAPMFDYDKANRMKLQNQFRNGKVSPFSLEDEINKMIDSYNDNNLYGRLHAVSLTLDSLGSFLTDTFYSRLISDEWENENSKMEIENQILESYCRMFQSEGLIEQMIGVSNK